MKRIIFCVILYLLCSRNIFSESYPFENQKYVYIAYYDDFSYPGFTGFRMELENKKILLDIAELVVKNYDPETGIFIDHTIDEEYSISTHRNFYFLSTLTKKYMVLNYENNILILIDCKNHDTLWGFKSGSKFYSIGSRGIGFAISRPTKSYIKYSSALEEDIAGEHIVYNGYSKYYLQLQVPWCPAGGNNGIGEWLETEAFTDTDELLIVNGFVRADKPDWYYNNARVKNAFIDTEQGSWFITLKDTPHPQIIKLPKKVSGRIRLTIDDVYEGEKYKDVCLAGFYMLYKTPEKR